MLQLALYICVSILWLILFRELLNKGLRRRQREQDALRLDIKRLAQENEKMKLDNLTYQKSSDDTVALYDLTKEICKTLDEGRIFKIFKESLSKYIGVPECYFIKDSALLDKYKGYVLFPLMAAHNQLIGHLAVSEVKASDQEKFAILAQQFMVGMRRSILYQRVQELTITDSLTQVYNRRYFLERFEGELKRAQKNKLKLCFLMVDVDNFKQYNDRYGHLVGDAVLRQVAKTIHNTVRQIDFIGRYGGEEISIVLAETDRQQGKFAAERIRRVIEDFKFNVYDENLNVTISIGASLYPDDAMLAQNLIEAADGALYSAKNSGKNKVCFAGVNL